LFHLDLYRLETPAHIRSAGIGDFLSPDGVAVIEWAERLEAEGGRRKAENKTIAVNIEILSETERKIIYDDFGA
jgi:tRNA A37 threonylcarbamoyladenosine biosynthesis protein TsaE